MTFRMLTSASVFYFLASSMALAHPGDNPNAKTQKISALCKRKIDIARSALSEFSKPSDVLYSDAPWYPPLSDIDDKDESRWKRRWDGEAPSLKVIRLWLATPHRSLVEQCVPDGLKTRRMDTLKGDGEYREPYRSTIGPYDDLHGPLDVWIGDPYIGLSGTEALVIYGIYNQKDIGGNKSLAFLRKKGNKWDVIGRFRISNS